MAQRRLKSWGAEFVGNGEVRFRIWAPGVDILALKLGGNSLAMMADDHGWFELTVSGVAPGTPYSFVLPDGLAVPDPASRAQASDVHGPSLVCDPSHYAWQDGEWTGRPWEEAVIYELHLGTFTPEGTFRAAAQRLQNLASLGVTAIEIMPVAQFAGDRGWGYDGVLLYAPHRAYGSPDDMKAFIDEAHARGMMVLLDVVYNHFGPDGNYLHLLTPAFFHPERHTPWGGAIAYEKHPVRGFFIENVLYWLEEFHLDGLRFDAVDQIRDPDSETEILIEIAKCVRAGFPDRHIHLVTEDNRNITHLHERGDGGRTTLFTAEWNDDFHNAAHAIATREKDGYYEDFFPDRWHKLTRSLAEGYAYQGEHSSHWGMPRGKPSAHLPPAAFIDFLQNHDQIGNRAFGERLLSLAEPRLVRALTAMMILSPHIPMFFMGEEWGETRPFYYFTDFHGDLARAVREGRRREFAKFSSFASEKRREKIPDPNAPDTFAASKLDWEKLSSEPGRQWFEYIQKLLALRRQHIVPLLRNAGGNTGHMLECEEGVIAVDWLFAGGLLQLRANLTDANLPAPAVKREIILADPSDAYSGDELRPYAVVVAIARRA